MTSADTQVEFKYLSTAICVLAERTQRAPNAEEAKNFAEAVCSLSYALESLIRLQSQSKED